MSKKTDYCIYNKFNRSIVMTGAYDDCLIHFNKQDKIFRKHHKLVNKKDIKFK